jgi:Protein of unknown function (DUF3618)
MDNTLNQNGNERNDTSPRVAIYDEQSISQGNPETNHASTSPDKTLHKEPLITNDFPQNSSKHSPEELEHSIEETQERIAESIDELAKRLNPTHLKNQAVQNINDSLNIEGFQHMLGDIRGSLSEGAKTSGLNLLGGVKHNPLSAVLMGAGVGVVALGGIMAAKTQTTQSYNGKRTYDERLRGMMNTIESNYGDNKPSQASESSKLDSAKSVVSENVHRAKDGLGQVLEAQPIAVGAVALLVGAAIGLLLPRTRYEDSLMGDRSDELISQAKGKASEVVDVAKSTVSDVVQTAKDTVGEVVQTAKDTAKETVKAATA